MKKSWSESEFLPSLSFCKRKTAALTFCVLCAATFLVYSASIVVIRVSGWGFVGFWGLGKVYHVLLNNNKMYIKNHTHTYTHTLWGLGKVHHITHEIFSNRVTITKMHQVTAFSCRFWRKWNFDCKGPKSKIKMLIGSVYKPNVKKCSPRDAALMICVRWNTYIWRISV